MGSLFEMQERCSHCKTKYKIEPSFFYGAMYVSYAVGIAFAVAAFVISFLLLKASIITAFISIVITLVVFLPVIIRLSRNIWINIFIGYDPEAASALTIFISLFESQNIHLRKELVLPFQ